MKRMLAAVAVVAVLLGGKTAEANEWYQPSIGWVWQPVGWNYVVSGHVVYAPDDESWIYIHPNGAGPWTYFFYLEQWSYHDMVNGWNFFSRTSPPGGNNAAYIFFNAWTSYWYYYLVPVPTYYYNYTWQRWGEFL